MKTELILNDTQKKWFTQACSGTTDETVQFKGS